MEVLRGGRAGLHSELRRYIPNGCDGDEDDSIILTDFNRRQLLPGRMILKQLSKDHSPVPVGVVIPKEDMEDRKRYQLTRARQLHGTPDETPKWRDYYLKHLGEIMALN